MRVRAALSAAVLVPILVAGVACGSAGEAEPNSDTSGASPSTSASGTAADDDASDTGSAAEPAGPEIPADTEVADPVPAAQMPTATGDFGDKPTITMPESDPPDSLQRRVLSEGDGPESKAGDWLQVDYVGQIWGGDVFDNSYDRGAPITIQVGGPQRQVVAGWDVGLQGVKQGSRVMLSLPPRDGYGADGNADAGIAGTDTLVFVVDVVHVIDADAAGDPDATPQPTPTGLPPVSGALGKKPTITVPSDLPEPDDVSVTVLAKGHGDPVVQGRVLVQYVLTSWDGSHIESSWPAADDADTSSGTDVQGGTGMQLLPVTAQSVFGDLVGIPIGSRVLIETPADDSAGAPPLAWVMDLVAQ